MERLAAAMRPLFQWTIQDHGDTNAPQAETHGDRSSSMMDWREPGTGWIIGAMKRIHRSKN